jgi:signal transduction histidine kinase
MRERASLLGGTLNIKTGRGSGTKIRAEIPLEPPTDDDLASP